MRYATVCSGIEAPSVAWDSLGWDPVFFSQFDPEHNYKNGPDFPSKVLAHHYPNVPNLGDMNKIKGKKYAGTVDLICGGTPCQSFSVAGLRAGLTDPRGNLALVFLRLVDQIRPRWVIWENVPGVLSSNKGRDFGSFVGALEKLGYGFAYRVLDAQYVGVPQRRRRVFVVGYFGDWRLAAAVLFEPEGLRRNTPPRSAKGKEPASALTASTGRRGGVPGSYCVDQLVIMSTGQANAEIGTDVSPSLTCNHEAPIVFNYKATQMDAGTISPTLDVGKNGGVSVLYGIDSESNVSDAQSPIGCLLKGSPSGGGHLPVVNLSNETIRRLTPLECERLQGIPDNYTKISAKTKDGPRYKAIGNSMAVPVMRWIGQRIEMVDKIV